MNHASQPTRLVTSNGEVVPPLATFDYQPRTRVVFGPGSLDQLGQLAAELNGKRILMVTDPGLEEAGHAERGLRSLEEAGMKVSLFDDVTPNPTTEDVDRALAVARRDEVDLIVGLGGGSSMDCAKGANFLFTNGGQMADYWGVGKATKPMLPMIAVPTTAGTGSEAQSFALIANAETHMKMACGDRKAACKVAILDPELTLSMPASVTAATGIDAVSHTVETFVTKPRNAISQLYARKAWQLLSFGFPRVIDRPDNLEARGSMLLGAHFAGTAIENSMLGIAHSLANPLSAHFETTHGHAVGLMLPHVIRFNAEVVGPLYAQLAVDAGLEEATPDALADLITGWLKLAGLPTQLDEVGANRELKQTLAQEAAEQWTANFNPRQVTTDQFADLYESAWSQ